MRSVLAVISACAFFLLEAVLVIVVIGLLGVVGIKARAGASWIYDVLPVLSALTASAAGGYAAIRVTGEVFSDVAADTVYVSFTTLMSAYVAVSIALAFTTNVRVFASVGQAAAFLAASALALAAARVGLWHVKDYKATASA